VLPRSVDAPALSASIRNAEARLAELPAAASD